MRTYVGLVTNDHCNGSGRRKPHKKKLLPTCETINCVIILNYYASSVGLKHLEHPYQNQVYAPQETLTQTERNKKPLNFFINRSS